MGLKLSIIKKSVDEYIEKYGDVDTNLYDVTAIYPGAGIKFVDTSKPPAVLFRLANFEPREEIEKN